MAIALITAASAAIRLARLAVPRAYVFDEAYYAKDACLYLGVGQITCRVGQATEQSFVHPPLGKWLIAIGIKIFGYNHFGWRVVAAVFGTALVPLVYVLARKLFQDRWTAAVAALLVGADFLMIVQSRIAMLDIFQAFFIVLAFAFLAFDRERLLDLRDHARLPFPDDPPAREPEWRIAAGAAFGLALAVKWSTLWAMAGGGIAAALWSLAYFRARASARGSRDDPRVKVRGPRLLHEVLVTFLAFAIIPLLVYLTAYSKYFADTASNKCAYQGPQPAELRQRNDKGQVRGRLDFGVKPGQCVSGLKATVFAFVDLHERVLDYHLYLNADHPYKSKAWTWPLVKRPTVYYYEGDPKSTEIIGMGNPITWWASIAAGLWLIFMSLRRQPWRPERVVAIGWLAQYVPWLFVQRPLFFFYMTPIVPFMMIGLAAGLSELRDLGKIPKRLVMAFIVIGVIGMLYYFYPVIAAVGLSNDLWKSRMWFECHECWI